MKIQLNGKPTETDCLTLMDLVEYLGLDTDTLIAEHNFTLVSQETWSDILIRPDDTIELLSFVGGG